jgi:acetyl esterase/lipase
MNVINICPKGGKCRQSLTRRTELGSGPVLGPVAALRGCRAHDYFAAKEGLMKIIRTGLLALGLTLLIAAAPVKPSPVPAGKSTPAKQTAAKPSAKPAAKPAAKIIAAKKPTPAAPVAEASDAPKTYPLQSIAFPGGVTMTEIVYRSLPGFRPLTLDLYQTSEKSFPRPGLIFVHGGNWNSGDARHAGTFGDFPGLLASLAARGYVVASINYRLSGEAHFPAALQDVKSAISWLRGHADQFNLDQTRIAIWGASAGGHLASLAGVSCGVTALEPSNDPAAKERPPSNCVQAVIDWYGIIDFETMAADLGKPVPDKSVEGDFLGCEASMCAAGVARNASPLAYVGAMSPPFLIQQGATDTTVSPKQSQALYDALRAKGVPAEMVVYPGVAHSFARVPFAPDPATNKAAVGKLESFLDATFPKKPATSAYSPPKRQGLPY